MHGGIVDYANIVLLAKWEDRHLNRAVQHGVGWLVRGDRSDLPDALHLFHAEVGDANPTNFTLLSQIGHHAPCLFDLLIRLRPMHLVEIDGLDRKPAKTVFYFAANLLQAIAGLALLIPHQATFGEDIRLVGGRLEGARDDLL